LGPTRLSGRAFGVGGDQVATSSELAPPHRFAEFD